MEQQLILPDYIIKEIFRKLIDYLLINNKNVTNNINGYSLKRYYRYTSEITTYTLTSKNFFKIISTIITNNIIDNNIENWIHPSIIYYNNNVLSTSTSTLTSSASTPTPKKERKFKRILKRIFKSRSNRNSGDCEDYGDGDDCTDSNLKYTLLSNDTHDIIIINQDYSIINIEKEIIQEYFKNQVFVVNGIIDYQYDENEIPPHIDIIGKIILNITTKGYNDLQFHDLICKFQNKSKEIQVNFLNLSMDVKDRQLHIFNKHTGDGDGNGNDGGYYINKIQMTGATHLYISNNIFQEISNRLKPRVIKFDPNGRYTYDSKYYNHMYYKQLFDGNIVSEIKIKATDHIEPSDLIDINQLRSLHTLSIPLLLHDILNHKNGITSTQSCKSVSTGIRTTDDTFTQVIESLSINETIKNLTLLNICSIGPYCCSNYNIENYKHVSEWLNKLLDNHTLHYFKLVDFDFIDPKIAFSPLLNSSCSIKTLVLKFRSKEYTQIKKKLPQQDLQKNQQFPIIQYLMSTVFQNNNGSDSRIKHFKYIDGYCQFELISLIFNLLSQNIQSTSLYSLTILIEQSQYVKVIQQINQLPTIKTKFKEIILLISIPQFELNVNQILSKYRTLKVINNIIINIDKYTI